MSDLAATNCGCGCNEGNNGCGILFLILLLSCVCGNGNGGLIGGNGCGDNCCWIILLLLFCGGGHNSGFNFGGGCGCQSVNPLLSQHVYRLCASIILKGSALITLPFFHYTIHMMHPYCIFFCIDTPNLFHRQYSLLSPIWKGFDFPFLQIWILQTILFWFYLAYLSSHSRNF